FEPGQDVFREGDLGDRVYLVMSGSAEVWKAGSGAESKLARLGPGDWFGEMAAQPDDARGDRPLPRAHGRAEPAQDGVHGPGREPARPAAQLRAGDGGAARRNGGARALRWRTRPSARCAAGPPPPPTPR